MTDSRNELLAHQLIHYSLEIKKGEVLYLEIRGMESLALARCLIRKATEAGATTFWYFNDESLERHFVKGASEQQMTTLAQLHLPLMQRADAYIGLRGPDNSFELADVPAESMALRDKFYMKPVHGEERIKKTRWVVLRYPSNGMAQLAETSREAFADFYYNVCCLDYGRMSQAMDRLVELMQATDRVRLTGPGTNLTFSIKGMKAIKCDGKLNIPDGEVFTAPVRDSINGTIAYNAPSLLKGNLYKDIRFTFKNGKIIEATCATDSKRLNQELDIDEGSRYIGEFAVGVNPFILHPMKDILFDEKIKGSIHLTPGQCYDDAPNGNNSSLHWDLVLIQRAEYGGGEMWFDDKLVRKDGEFLDKDLALAFSVDNLKKT